MKKKYFSIVAPLYVSNLQGSLINTAKGFLEECDINMATFFTNSRKCEIFSNRYGTRTDVTIAVFDEQPNDFLAYDAEKVKKTLINNGDWDSELKNLSYSIWESKYKDEWYVGLKKIYK